MADVERDAGAIGGVDHRLRLCERGGHRFFAEHVFAGLGGRDDVLRVQIGRRCDVDRVDVVECE